MKEIKPFVWYEVDDDNMRMVDDETTYIVYKGYFSHTPGICSACFDPVEETWISNDGFAREIGNVTHFMLIPEPEDD
jgi:hypothetical protein